MAEIEKKGHDERHPVGEEAPKTDWQQAVEYVAENPKTVALAVGFLVVCIAAGGLYSLQSHARDRQVMTAYAAALNEEDAGARASALKEVAGGKSRWSGEALYLAGEASIEAKAYDEARKIFGQVLSDYGTTEYAAPAAEALAFLDENDGKLKEALEGYTGVFAKYAETFTGRRQPLNIARVHEALEQIPEAIEFYKKQSEAFPDSAAAAQSEQALARLKGEHPDLFPAEEAAESGHEGHDHPAEAPAVEAPAVEAPAAEPPAVETPAAEAPAVETPAAEAPAVETPAAEAPAVETPPANP